MTKLKLIAHYKLSSTFIDLHSRECSDYLGSQGYKMLSLKFSIPINGNQFTAATELLDCYYSIYL